MQAILEKLFAAADHHGEDSGEPDHTVGDLQDLLRCAWALMSPSQKMALLESSDVEDLTQAGARDAFEPEDLLAEIRQALAEQEAQVTAAGYAFRENEDGFYWETETEASTVFDARDDAVADAFEHLQTAS